MSQEMRNGQKQNFVTIRMANYSMLLEIIILHILTKRTLSSTQSISSKYHSKFRAQFRVSNSPSINSICFYDGLCHLFKYRICD